MQNEDMLQKMKRFLDKTDKTSVELKLESRLRNGETLLKGKSEELLAARKKVAECEELMGVISNQMKAIWDLAIELQAEAETETPVVEVEKKDDLV